MNKDRIAGTAKEAKGAVKQAIGKATGDAKLRTEGTVDKAEGKIQKAIGGVKDALKK
ncbi:MAG: CsbD family protein [Stellaceae bacterium]